MFLYVPQFTHPTPDNCLESTCVALVSWSWREDCTDVPVCATMYTSHPGNCLKLKQYWNDQCGSVRTGLSFRMLGARALPRFRTYTHDLICRPHSVFYITGHFRINMCRFGFLNLEGRLHWCSIHLQICWLYFLPLNKCTFELIDVHTNVVCFQGFQICINNFVLILLFLSAVGLKWKMRWMHPFYSKYLHISKQGYFYPYPHISWTMKSFGRYGSSRSVGVKLLLSVFLNSTFKNFIELTEQNVMECMH